MTKTKYCRPSIEVVEVEYEEEFFASDDWFGGGDNGEMEEGGEI